MSASLSFTGGDAMRAKLLGVAAQAHAAIARAVYQEGETVITASKERVPVDLGVLKSSGYTAPPVWTGDTVRVEVGFGGAASAYAAIQHEALHFRHPNGGGPKYLESVLNEHEAGFGVRVGQQVAAELGL